MAFSFQLSSQVGISFWFWQHLHIWKRAILSISALQNPLGRLPLLASLHQCFCQQTAAFRELQAPAGHRASLPDAPPSPALSPACFSHLTPQQHHPAAFFGSKMPIPPASHIFTFLKLECILQLICLKNTSIIFCLAFPPYWEGTSSFPAQTKGV